MLYSFIRCLLILFCFTFSTFAVAKNPTQPEKCPSVSALQMHLFRVAAPAQTGGWLAMQAISRYDTKELWLFGLMVDATNVVEAFKNAYKALPTLGYPIGPSDVLGVWFCDYTASLGYGGQARVIQ